MIDDVLATQFERTSTANSDNGLLHHKDMTELTPLNFTSNKEEDCNIPFSLEELSYALPLAKDYSPAPDDIH